MNTKDDQQDNPENKPQIEYAKNLNSFWGNKNNNAPQEEYKSDLQKFLDLQKRMNI